MRTGLLALWLVALALLAGCANTAATRGANGLELDLQTGAHQGFVALRVVALRPISALNPKWQSVEIRAAATGQRDELHDVTVKANVFFSGRYYPTESLYFAKLDAGRYDVTGFGSTGPGPGLLLALMMSDRSSAKLPGFTVEAGGLTNLGTIVYAPSFKGDKAEGKDRGEQLFLLNGPMGKRAALDMLQAESRRPDVPLAEGGGWSSMQSADEEQRQLALAREQVSMLYVQGADSGIVAGSHLGQIFRRSPGAALQRETVDTLGTVFSAGHTADGRWVAGGEYGTYYVKQADGHWQPHRLPGDSGRVVHIEPRGPNGVVLITTSDMQSRFWARDRVADASEQPREVAKVAAAPDTMLSTPTQWVLFRNIPGISRKAESFSVQKADFGIRTRTEKFWVNASQALPGGELRLTRQNGVSFYPARSVDDGKTWLLQETVSGAGTYWVDAQRGYGLDWKSGLSTVDNFLQKTTDAGKTFQRVGTPIETSGMLGRIVYADSAEILFQGSDLLYSTKDEGQTWVRVLPGR